MDFWQLILYPLAVKIWLVVAFHCQWMCVLLSFSFVLESSTLFNFPGDVIGNIKVFLASFNFKYFRPLQRPCLLMIMPLFCRIGGLLLEAFLDPSDSCFLFADLVGFYTHWTYMHIFRHIFLSNYWWQRLPTIWHTYMKLVTKYQIPVINSCWEKCNEKCAYTNVC
jgi:hypothetical protein